MTYLSAKKIYPGNWAEPLNGWYKNIDTNDDSTNNASKGGPTSVLAIPGYRYFQQRGYVAVTATSGAGAIGTGNVIVPSPYRQDDTRPDITGMVISGDSTLPAYVYRATISVASGWGDGRVASGIYAATGNVITFCRDSSGPVASTGVGEAVAQANLTSTTSGSQPGEIFFAAGSAAYGTNPFLTATGAAGVIASGVNLQVTGATTFKVFARGTTTGLTTSGGFYISSGDSTSGRSGYLVVEVCYIQPDEAAGYEDIDGYLLGRTVS
jgi:hypothetical protein